MTARTVMLSVDCPDDATFVNLFELLARHCAGLILPTAAELQVAIADDVDYLIGRTK
jgi:hypothetical protein